MTTQFGPDDHDVLLAEARANDAAVQELEKEETPLFTAWDRCDRCGAQAYIRIDNGTPGRVLLFCNHHFNKHGKALMEQGFDTIDDGRHLLFDAGKPVL